MSDLDSYFWKLLDVYLEEHFVEHEDAREGFNQDELNKFMSASDWVGIRCHYK